jgi:hypothetical protein
MAQAFRVTGAGASGVEEEVHAVEFVSSAVPSWRLDHSLAT